MRMLRWKIQVSGIPSRPNSASKMCRVWINFAMAYIEGSPALLILLANSSCRVRVGHQPREGGSSRHLARAIRQPVRDPDHVDCRRRGDVLQVGFRLPDVTRATQATRPYPLGNRPLDPRAPVILGSILFR